MVFYYFVDLPDKKGEEDKAIFVDALKELKNFNVQ